MTMLDFVFYFRLAFALGVFCQAGLLFLAVVRIEGVSPVEKLCLAFGLGVGLVTFEMLLLSLFGQRLTVVTIIAPWGAAWAAYLIFVADRHWPALKRMQALWATSRSMPRSRPGLMDTLLLALLGAVVLTVVFRGTFHPLVEWDGWAIWDLKARAFFYARSLFPFVNDTYYALAHLDYPLLYPLAGTFVYLMLGQVTDGVAILPAIFYAALLGIVYAALRRYGGRRSLSLALTLGLAIIPSVLFWSQQFYAEIPLLYYVAASGLFLFFYFRERRLSWLLLSAALAGLATQTKIEGILLVAVSVAMLAFGALTAAPPQARRQLWKAAGLYVLGIALAYLPWFVFRRFLAPLPNGLSYWDDGPRLIQNIASLPTIFATIAGWMVQPAYQNAFFLIYPLAGLLVVLNWKRYARQLPFAYLLLYCLLLPLPSILLFLVEPRWLELVSLGRYLLVFTGTVYLLLAFQMIDLFQPSPDQAKRQSLARVVLAQRLLVGLLFLAVAVELGADLWPGLVNSAPFTSRPVSLVRQVYAEARDMLPLDPAQRQELLNVRFARPDYGRLIQVALAATPADENVVLWERPDNTDDYLFQKSYYWLYPRKVTVLRQPMPPTPAQLAGGVGTVIVYDPGQPWSGAGYPVYQPTPRFAVVRLNASAAAPDSPAGFVAAPVVLDQGIQLVGYQIVPPLLNGDALIVLTWRGTLPLTRSYTAFVHVFSRDQFVVQNDSIPVLGQFPTELWTPGEMVLDAHRVALPSDQRAQLKICIGMYDSTTLQRVSVIRADGYDVSDNVACRPILR